jgi:hypothetical protein
LLHGVSTVQRFGCSILTSVSILPPFKLKKSPRTSVKDSGIPRHERACHFTPQTFLSLNLTHCRQKSMEQNSAKNRAFF